MKQWYKNRKKDHFYLKAKKNDVISRAYYKIEEIDKRFRIVKKNSRVLIVEDVITTGKSSLECANLIKKAKAKLVGFVSIIDRSNKKVLRIKNKIISQIKIDVPSYKKKDLPKDLKSIPITKPGSRFLK